MFPGPAADAINNNCLACHSAGMVLNQPALQKSAWQGEVTKMIQSYKAPVSEEDVAAIVDYLASMKAAR
jgi:mono/diheme cytochrome c family protein